MSLFLRIGAIAVAFASSNAFAIEPLFQRENLSWALTNTQPAPVHGIIFDDDMDRIPDGVDFTLPSRLLRSVPQARITAQPDDSRCKIVGIIRSGKNYIVRVETSMSWDDMGCDVTIWVQSIRGPKRITTTIQQIGS